MVSHRLSLSIAVCLLVAAASAAGQSNWTAVNSGARVDLVAVYFTSDKNGWIAGDGGFLASTTNGGASWTKYPLDTKEDINEIYFRNSDNGYLVAGRVMYITHDGGKTWRQTRLYESADVKRGTPEFLSIRFAGKKIGIAVGSVVGKDDTIMDSLVMRTEDGGDTWQRIQVPSKVELYHLDFTDSDHAWIVGAEGLIMATTDGGITWRVQNSGVRKPIFNVDFRDDDNGYAVGGGGTVLRTQDGGRTWSQINAGFNQSLMRVDFADDKNGWIVGYGGAILRSADKGATWVRQTSNTNQKIYGLFMSKKYGWAVGQDGLILKYEK